MSGSFYMTEVAFERAISKGSISKMKHFSSSERSNSVNSHIPKVSKLFLQFKNTTKSVNKQFLKL